jgi:hypothetical protein
VEVEEGFFLDRVDILSDTPAIDQGKQSTLPILAHPAAPAFAGRNQAGEAAQAAAHPPFTRPFPEHRLAHDGLLHGSIT